ncbi:MAG: hypothetical protein QOG32_1419, partial [Chloroflexota bacterium]|nr:hypothetical protein [Chloroflexota bacterium]
MAQERGVVEASVVLRQRQPLGNPEISRVYRRNFESFASPWWLSRPPLELIRALPRDVLRGITGSTNGD